MGLSDPFAGIPVMPPITLDAHVYNVPEVTVEFNVMVWEAKPEQRVWRDGTDETIGIGLTVIVYVFGIPGQFNPDPPLKLGIMV